MRKIIRLNDDDLNPRGKYNQAAGEKPNMWTDFMGLSSAEINYAYAIIYTPEHGEAIVFKQKYRK